MVQKTDKKALDAIIDDMTDVVKNSKDEIFHISEEAHKEYDYLQRELEETKLKVLEYIKSSQDLEVQVKNYRKRLSIVSKEFDRYSEDEIRAVYEKTHSLQTKLAMMLHDEKMLRLNRDELERRIVRLKNTIEHAESLGSKISSILTYLDSDFKQVNEILQDAHEKQRFGLKIIEAQEEERKKLSREIHDGPAQMLANLLIRSEIIDLSFREGGIDDALNEIKNIRSTIRQSLYEVRRIIYDLRPMALDDLGLLPTLNKYIKTISDYNSIKIELISLGDEQRLDTEYEVAFFRLIQEALQNAVKHAESDLIKVKIEMNSERTNIIIEDNGVGFDPLQTNDNSFGLVGMRERIDLLGGEFTINSTIGKGTTIVIQVPFKKDDL